MSNFEELQFYKSYTTGINVHSTLYCYEIIKRLNKTGSVLELGPAEGVMTRELVKDFDEVTVIDANTHFCKRLKNSLNIGVINNTFEDTILTKKYDLIIMNHILEHVEKPVKLLKKYKKHLKKDGLIFISVPNAHSLHRWIGKELGIVESVYQLTSRDLEVGHKRVYCFSKLLKHLNKAKLEEKGTGGYWIKMSTNKELEDNYNSKSLNTISAHMKVGEDYPGIAAEIYCIAK